MGFRELQKFNIALLAKQVWRLQHEKHSLFYKVFQAKFFPTTMSTILDAKENSWGSYAWRSILWARKVICSGLWWRIGDGSQVKIWGDKWLTDPHLPKLISPCPTELVDCNVSRIIDSITKSWNIDEIKSFLLPFEAKAIQCIPLSFQGARDTMIWFASQDGAFSIQSAYWLLLNEETSLIPCSSSANYMCFLWKSIWGLSVTPKVRNFLWWACNGALSTKINLWKRNVLSNLSTPKNFLSLHMRCTYHHIGGLAWYDMTWLK